MAKGGGKKRQTHGSTETTVDFEDGELVEVGRVLWLWEVGIGDNLIVGGRLDTIPIAASTISGGSRKIKQKRTYRSWD